MINVQDGPTIFPTTSISDAINFCRFAGLIAAADSGLSSGRRFRAGWGGNWAFAHVGDAHDSLADGGNIRCDLMFSIINYS